MVVTLPDGTTREVPAKIAESFTSQDALNNFASSYTELSEKAGLVQTLTDERDAFKSKKSAANNEAAGYRHQLNELKVKLSESDEAMTGLYQTLGVEDTQGLISAIDKLTTDTQSQAGFAEQLTSINDQLKFYHNRDRSDWDSMRDSMYSISKSDDGKEVREIRSEWEPHQGRFVFKSEGSELDITTIRNNLDRYKLISDVMGTVSKTNGNLQPTNPSMLPIGGNDGKINALDTAKSAGDIMGMLAAKRK